MSPRRADASPMRCAWVGSHREGLPALEALLDAGADVVAAVTLTADAAARPSGVADYEPLCSRFGVPLHQVADINSPAAVTLLRSLDVDVLFVIGWSQILRPAALEAARIGGVGAHASILPKNRGADSRRARNRQLADVARGRRGHRRPDRSDGDRDHALRHLRHALRSGGAHESRHAREAVAAAHERGGARGAGGDA